MSSGRSGPRRVSEAAEVIEIARERVGIARHVDDDGRLEPRQPFARERARAASGWIHHHRVEARARIDERAQRARDVRAVGLDVQSLRLRRRPRLCHRRGERLHQANARPRGREPERDRARAPVQIENPWRMARRRGASEADGFGQQRVHPRGLSPMGLDEGAESGEVHRPAEPVGYRSDAREKLGLVPQDLGRLAVVEVRGDPCHLRQLAHQLERRSLQRLEGGDTRAMDDERDEHALRVTVAQLAKVHRAQGTASRRIVAAERAPDGLVAGEARAQRGGNSSQRRRQDPATRDVHELVPAALGEQANLASLADDELRPRPVGHDR